MSIATQNDLELVRDAAFRGVADAQLIYGQILLDGKLLDCDPGQAFHWFERAALGGNVLAMNMVGRCLEQGWGVARSATLAAPWFRRSAEEGNEWGMYNLATLLTLGDGVAENKAEAYLWLKRAAEMGHAKSINILGGFYEDGWEVQRDMEKARECYRQAAMLGDFRGYFNFARFLIEEGKVSEAIYWLKKVPETATPAFLAKMRGFFINSPVVAVREFAESLSTEKTVTV